MTQSEGQEPLTVEPFHEDPETVSQLADNAVVAIYNRLKSGEITAIQAKELMDGIEDTRIQMGDGWFDLYGPPPPELDHLFVGEERYWEKGVGDREP